MKKIEKIELLKGHISFKTLKTFFICVFLKKTSNWSCKRIFFDRIIQMILIKKRVIGKANFDNLVRPKGKVEKRKTKKTLN